MDDLVEKEPDCLPAELLFDRSNLEATIIKDGYHWREDIY